MAKRVKIIGLCDFCGREVAEDGRPINSLEPQEAITVCKLISHNMDEDAVALLENDEMQVKEEDADERYALASQSGIHETETTHSLMMDAMLDTVKERFERPPEENTDSPMSLVDAENIMDILVDEQRSYEEFQRNILRKRMEQLETGTKSLEKAKKKKKSAVRR